MRNYVLISAIIITFFTSLDIQAQSTKTVLEDVILFNSEPYMVRMTPKGKILAFISDIDNGYAALNKVTAKSVELSIAEVDNSIDLARVNGNNLDQKSVAALLTATSGSRMPTNAIANAEITPEDELSAKGEAAEDSGPAVSTTNYDYEFAFDHRDATLSPSSVNQLNEIAKILSGNSTSQLKINSYFSESVDVSKILSKNRAKGILDMLVSKGIDKSRISISESNNEDWANNRVKVSIH